MNSTEKKSYFHYSPCIEQECGHSQSKNFHIMNFNAMVLDRWSCFLNHLVAKPELVIEIEAPQLDMAENIDEPVIEMTNQER